MSVRFSRATPRLMFATATYRSDDAREARPAGSPCVIWRRRGRGIVGTRLLDGATSLLPEAPSRHVIVFLAASIAVTSTPQQNSFNFAASASAGARVPP